MHIVEVPRPIDTSLSVCGAFLPDAWHMNPGQAKIVVRPRVSRAPGEHERDLTPPFLEDLDLNIIAVVIRSFIQVVGWRAEN
jgi:hypothetical protein